MRKYTTVIIALSCLLLAACSSPVVRQSWQGTSRSGSVSQALSLELNLSGQRAWGEYHVGVSAGSLRGTVEGDALTATLTAGPECVYSFEGSSTATSLTGTYTPDACAGGASGSWDLALR